MTTQRCSRKRRINNLKVTVLEREMVWSSGCKLMNLVSTLQTLPRAVTCSFCCGGFRETVYKKVGTH